MDSSYKKLLRLYAQRRFSIQLEPNFRRLKILPSFNFKGRLLVISLLILLWCFFYLLLTMRYSRLTVWLGDEFYEKIRDFLPEKHFLCSTNRRRLTYQVNSQYLPLTAIPLIEENLSLDESERTLLELHTGKQLKFIASERSIVERMGRLLSLRRIFPSLYQVITTSGSFLTSAVITDEVAALQPNDHLSTYLDNEWIPSFSVLSDFQIEKKAEYRENSVYFLEEPRPFTLNGLFHLSPLHLPKVRNYFQALQELLPNL